MTLPSAVFTIGHSTHPRGRFIELLRRHGITALCDVRSRPYSRMNPQFNREELERALSAHTIAYRFLGRELGARSDDPACYKGGKVRYDRLAETDLFKDGLKRVLRGLEEGFRVALMCAEKEPLECHRTILVARHLVALGLDVEHIHADGSLENHTTALAHLMRILHLHQDHLFLSHEELLADAYRRQEGRIAYDQADQDAATVRGGSE
jgi:uncharacterized protein (DUF488 family)